ncbi:MAG: hypothetical protein A3E87_01810 [Gammaproteobacteria bacterium RIFCSPHIGHO2_12_FULL_35_23]|nr:MAG: hypothetical protein A3E87_01810 [Gammaproteobacteria bacterium RIFCSPHIGHO2_12_FULL_35_23]
MDKRESVEERVIELPEETIIFLLKGGSVTFKTSDMNVKIINKKRIIPIEEKDFFELIYSLQRSGNFIADEIIKKYL